LSVSSRICKVGRGKQEILHHFHVLTDATQALLAVLKINLKHIKSASYRIDAGNFAIQDSATKRDVDIEAPWDSCFLPGQRVEMAMIFCDPFMMLRACPNCGTASTNKAGQDSEW
jgi:hypothetical protein